MMKRLEWIGLIIVAAVLAACQPAEPEEHAAVHRALGGPDLVVKNIVLDTPRIAPGLVIAASCDVENAGTALAGASQLKYYLSLDQVGDASDRYLNYDGVGPLDPQAKSPETANLRVPAGTAFGRYFILFVADQKAEVPETNELNNTAAVPVEVFDPNAPVVTGPDLAVEQVVLSASSAVQDEAISVSCVVKNRGQQEAAASRIKYYFSTDAVFDASDAYRNYDAVPALAAGAESPENASVRIPADVPDGTYYILIVADVDGAVPEGTEENNVASAAVAVGDVAGEGDQPNLFPQQVYMSSDTWSPGVQLTGKTVIMNSGGGSGECKIRYHLSRDTLRDEFDIQLGYNKIYAMGPGGMETKEPILRVPDSTDGGSWFVLFIVDADGEVAESDETDNVKVLPLTVALDRPDAVGPDLLPVDVTTDRRTALPGDAIAFSSAVKNAGNLPAVESRLKYFLSSDQDYQSSDGYLNYNNISALEPDQSFAARANVRIPLKTAYGDWYILLVADHTAVVPERIESNNVVAVKITVTDQITDQGGDEGGGDKPDLIVTDVVMETAEVRAGANFNVSLSVRNIGVSDAPGSRVKYYLSRDTTYNTGDRYAGYDTVEALAGSAAGPETAAPLVPADFGHGVWHLLLVADANNEVEEAREDNNVTAVPFTVLVDDPDAEKADLLVPAASMDEAAYSPNSKVAATFSILNDGVIAAPPTRAKLYWSANPIRGVDDAFLDYRLVPELDPGESVQYGASLRAPRDAAEGEYYILVAADANGSVEESYESNNVAVLNVTVSAAGKAPGVYPFPCPEYVNHDLTVYDKGAVASFNALHLGYENKKDMAAMACIVSHFRLAGLQEVENEQGVIALVTLLETITGMDWDHHVSPKEVGDENGMEYYAYVWRTDSVQFIGSAGFFPDPNEYIKREPYGASFMMGSFDFTFVVFHQRKGNTLGDTRAEAIHLKEIYDHFQSLDGGENDVIIAGDFNLPGDDPAYTIVGYDGVTYTIDPEQKTSISQYGLINSYDNVFYPAWALTELRESGVLDFTTGNYETIIRTVSDHIPVWITVDTAADDD